MHQTNPIRPTGYFVGAWTGAIGSGIGVVVMPHLFPAISNNIFVVSAAALGFSGVIVVGTFVAYAIGANSRDSEATGADERRS